MYLRKECAKHGRHSLMLFNDSPEHHYTAQEFPRSRLAVAASE